MIVYGKNEDETVRLTAEALGMSEVDVRFMLAIGKGEKSGDVVSVDSHPKAASPRRDANRPARQSRRSVPVA